jgi:hypothetical protein
MRSPAQSAEGLLRQVGGLVPDFPEAFRPGQHACGSDREHEGQQVAAAPATAGVRDQREHFQQAGDLPWCVFIGAGDSHNAGMRSWHGGLSFRSDLA